jgi:hypothetical protein
MSGAVVPMAFDGALVRLFPGFAWWQAMNASGRKGWNSDAQYMVFDAGSAMRSGDLVAGFWRDEAGDMDWLEDFVCDPHLVDMIEVLQAPEEDEDEVEEIHYSKRELTTFGSDVIEKY